MIWDFTIWNSPCIKWGSCILMRILYTNGLIIFTKLTLKFVKLSYFKMDFSREAVGVATVSCKCRQTPAWKHFSRMISTNRIVLSSSARKLLLSKVQYWYQKQRFSDLNCEYLKTISWIIKIFFNGPFSV